MKKLLCLFLAILTCFGATACNSSAITTKPVANGTLSDVEVWGAPATEKVLQNVHGIYDHFRSDAKIDVTTAKGEYEGQHIILTAKSKPVKYFLVLGNLIADDGTEFPASNFEVFHEKYIYVSRNFDKTAMPTGYYPDALVPYQNIVNVGENVVNANENQGLYFRFNVPIDQKAGVYTGKVTLTIAGSSMDIPVKLTVEDLVVNEETHSKTNFFSRGLFHKGELESTQRMLDLYNEKLLEYRVSNCGLVQGSYHTDEEIEYYVEKAYDFMQDPRCSIVVIPYATEKVQGYTCIKASVFESYLRAFAKKSVETNYNMLKKLVCYLGIIDEPQLNGTFEALKVVVTVYRDTITKVADDIANDASIVSPIKDEIVASMRKVRNTITTHYDAEFAEYIDTWCPMYHMYDGELIHNYANQEERWWYGCISPRAPYPTYHIEDTLLSARAVSWMMAEYGIVGNLYWGFDLYAMYDGEKYHEIEDYYGGDAERFDQCNGDGWLLYPGKKYGIDGPVGSLRLEAIRDGIEEYELFYSMMQTYNQVNEEVKAINPALAFSPDKVIKSLTGSIYTGTKVSTTSATFQSARDSLFEIAQITEETGALILDFKDDNRGNVTYKLLAPNTVTVKNNGIVLSETSTVGKYKLYTVVTALNNDANYLNLSFEADGKTYNYVKHLGGKVQINSASTFIAGDFGAEPDNLYIEPTFASVDASTVNSSLVGKLAKVSLTSAGADIWQEFTFAGNVVNGLSSNTSKMILEIYSESKTDIKFTIYAKYQKEIIYGQLATGTLKQGVNKVEISLSATNWAKLGNIEFCVVRLGEKSVVEPARSIYFGETVIYNK